MGAVAMASPSVVGTVLRHEWRSVLRNRGVLVFGVGTLLLTEIVLRLTGSAPRALSALLNLVLLVVPLVTTMAGIISWHESREFNELLLTQPVRRRSLFVALYLALVLPLAVVFALGLLLPMAWHRVIGPETSGLLLSTVGGGVALTFVFGGLALLIGSLFRTRERSVQLMIGLAMPILFVAGLAWPGQALPPLLQGLRWLLPSTAGIQGFVALNQLGAHWSEIANEVWVLSALLPGFTVLAAWRWRAKAAPPTA